MEHSETVRRPAAAMVASARSLHGDPWFTEVIELRKRAKDYMVR